MFSYILVCTKTTAQKIIPQNTRLSRVLALCPFHPKFENIEIWKYKPDLAYFNGTLLKTTIKYEDKLMWYNHWLSRCVKTSIGKTTWVMDYNLFSKVVKITFLQQRQSSTETFPGSSLLVGKAVTLDCWEFDLRLRQSFHHIPTNSTKQWNKIQKFRYSFWLATN